MKSLFYIIVMLFMGANIVSCTPENIVDEVIQPQACCDGESSIPPPPPPPPGDDDPIGG
ncbi:hypothetical protein [Psychroserpens algicola]|uniref:Uncharacterized protein n=1 Tax=Psychroserpens algicola TaxID=1719034 RepID=A0ABT0H983_9FLAO|nr:hypothetical protein [Psychroserpens algicola]MCK8480928.1 hypothetical protein [Psychroserpens algicola]